MHLVEALSRERGILEVQIGSQRVRYVHAHLLNDMSLLHHLYVTSYDRLLTDAPSGGLIS